MKIDKIYDISIPLKFGGEQPNAYGVPAASSAACESGEIVGDTRLGGSCNFESYTLIPHCNGTHTECVGHITDERISVRDCLQDVLVPAVLVSISPTNFSLLNPYNSPTNFSLLNPENTTNLSLLDKVITRELLENALASGNLSISDKALVVRTLPNDDTKLTRKYGDEIPPYFATDAMEFIVKNNVKHLLVDLPSIDRIYDEGKLANHRIFWNVEPGKFETNAATRTNATITELIFVPNNIADGDYTLNLQIAPFNTDAAPSRPLLLKYS